MNLTRNFYRIWLVLLVISGGIALWFSGIALGGAWKYFRLNAFASAQVLHWQTQEISSSRYAIEAEYQFEVAGKAYKGKTIFERPQFLNRFAAENYIAINGSKSWQAWYRKGGPGFSSLEKEFPKKKCLQAVLTLGVFFYFFFARTMVSRINGKQTLSEDRR